MTDKKFLTNLAHARLGKTDLRKSSEVSDYCRENGVEVVPVDGASIEVRMPEGIVYVALDAFTETGRIKKRLTWYRRVYRVRFYGEREFDEDGNVIPSLATNSEDEAYRLAVEWFERTACIADITSELEML